MSEHKDMEKQFFDLQEMLIKDSEKEFKLVHESREYPEGWPETAPENIVLSKIGVSSQELEELEAELDKSDEKIVQHYLENVRPELSKGPDTPNDALRKHLRIAAPTLGETRVVKPCNCTIVTDELSLLKGREGKAHNPWLDPASAEYQDMLVRYGGRGGWGCWGRDERSGSFDCHWVYPFKSDSDRGRPYYRFDGEVEFRGFFSCIAHGRCCICRSARVRATLMLRVYQFGSEVSRTQTTIMDHSGDHIHVVDRYDGVRSVSEPDGVFLHPDSATFVVVTAHIFARARGSGSFAEINFNDGSTNWVRGQDLNYNTSSYGPPR